MSAFAAGEIGVLVSTTVVEVGVDVPAASVMVVLDADRFGLSQLHQLRGRVGRGSAPGLCLLVTDAAPDSHAGERLAALAATTDGFALAQLDLQQRREGDVLVAAQSGRGGSLRLLRVVQDADVIARARTFARDVVAADPDLGAHPALAAAIDRLLGEEGEEFLARS
jgi:ATP-dependent DNA helicase RecG